MLESQSFQKAQTGSQALVASTQKLNSLEQYGPQSTEALLLATLPLTWIDQILVLERNWMEHQPLQVIHSLACAWVIEDDLDHLLPDQWGISFEHCTKNKDQSKQKQNKEGGGGANEN